MATKSTRPSTSDKAVKSSFKPITGKKPAAAGEADAKAAKAKTAAEKPEKAGDKKRGSKAKTEPAEKMEVVSLIDDQPKAPRKRVAGESTGKVLPSISKIRSPEPEVPAAPVVAEAELPAPVAAEVAPSLEISETGEKIIHIKPPIVVKDLATQMGVKSFVLIKDLMALGIFANQNQTIEVDVASRLCESHGFKFERDKREKGGGVHKEEKKVEAPKPPKPTDVSVSEPDVLKSRAPIVTFMGHVDHGKTTLMDTIRKSRVAAGEAGGITQHIGAYLVKYKGKDGKDHPITFLDTPGHAAFTAMRARGASVTDIVILVIDATDGIMPQTQEALSHARAANVKIIVAITKIDLVSANVDRVKGQLQEKGLVPEDWGGETIVCPVSAIKGTGMDGLMESILLESEMLELKSSHKVPACASVIEAQVEQGRGPTATVIVKAGTLKVGDPFICGDYSGKVKGLIDDLGKPIKEAGPSTPAKIIGFAGMPNAGDELLVMDSERSAQHLSQDRLDEKRLGKLSQPNRATLENLFATIAKGEKPALNIVIKGDVQGSLEAICVSITQIPSNKVEQKIVHSAVGPINENDVLLAAASNAVIIGFNTKVENNASNAARRENIQVKLFSIIYELIDQVKESMAGMLEPESREQVIGHAQVKQVFDLTKGVVAGCSVTDGRIQRSGRARVLRNRQPIYDGGLSTLRRFQDDVKEVRSGVECGIKLGDYDEYEVGDIIECYILEKVSQTL